METIEKEFQESKLMSPKVKSRVGGWFSCETCTTMQSARLSKLSMMK